MENDINKRDWVGGKRPRSVRTIGTTRRSVSGFFIFKGEKSIPYESGLERDFLIRLSLSRFVNDIISQPVQLKYLATNGNSYRYTPDYLVYFDVNSGPTWHQSLAPLLVEVKPREKIRKEWAKMRPRCTEAIRYANAQGWKYHIYDESRIRDQRFQNIMFLQRYKRMQFSNEESQWIIANLKAMGQAPFDYLLARHFFGSQDKAVGISHLWHLLYSGAIECDLSLPLNNNTILWVPAHD